MAEESDERLVGPVRTFIARPNQKTFKNSRRTCADLPLRWLPTIVRATWPFAIFLRRICIYSDHSRGSVEPIGERSEQMLGDNTLLSPVQAAELLGVKEQTLANWRSTKRYPLPYVKIGRNVKYRLGDVENLIESSVISMDAT